MGIFIWSKFSMKKICTFLYISLILFSVFACTIPSELEFTGSPSVKFAANMDFGDYFSEMVDNVINADSAAKTLPCTNPTLKYMAFIMRMEVFHKENYKFDDVDWDLFDDKGIGDIIINNDIKVPVELIDDGNKFFVLKDSETISENKEDNPYIITFEGIEDYLEGFEFSGIHAKIYISGSELSDIVNIELRQIKPDGTIIPIVPDGKIIKGPSGIKDLEEYTDIGLPEGGAEIDINDIINTGGDLALLYRVYLPKDSEIELEWLNNLHNIAAEIVIWLPMTFDSKADDAIIKFPDMFDGLNDAIKSFAGIGFIENMGMKIGINPLNPFGHGLLIMRDDNYGDIISPLDENNFYFNFTNEDLDYINNNEYNPHFFILYPKKNSLLEIPGGDILITTITLNAKIKYNMEL
jgi:hypothetical protein